VGHGQTIALDQSLRTSLVRAYAPDGSLVALLQPNGEPSPPSKWRPKKVFKQNLE
jgi:hypothetical protein